jgi:hypothetical protein
MSGDTDDGESSIFMEVSQHKTPKGQNVGIKKGVTNPDKKIFGMKELSFRDLADRRKVTGPAISFRDLAKQGMVKANTKLPTTDEDSPFQDSFGMFDDFGWNSQEDAATTEPQSQEDDFQKSETTLDDMFAEASLREEEDEEDPWTSQHGVVAVATAPRKKRPPVRKGRKPAKTEEPDECTVVTNTSRTSHSSASIKSPIKKKTKQGAEVPTADKSKKKERRASTSMVAHSSGNKAERRASTTMVAHPIGKKKERRASTSMVAACSNPTTNKTTKTTKDKATKSSEAPKTPKKRSTETPEVPWNRALPNIAKQVAPPKLNQDTAAILNILPSGSPARVKKSTLACKLPYQR